MSGVVASSRSWSPGRAGRRPRRVRVPQRARPAERLVEDHGQHGARLRHDDGRTDGPHRRDVRRDPPGVRGERDGRVRRVSPGRQRMVHDAARRPGQRPHRRRPHRPSRGRRGGRHVALPDHGRRGVRAARPRRFGLGRRPDGRRPGDLDGDGNADLLAIDTAGVLWRYRGQGNGGFSARERMGAGWQSMSVVVGGGDWNSDGRADFLARDGAGRLYLYRGAGNGFDRAQIGTGWGSMRLLTVVRDWDGDGLLTSSPPAPTGSCTSTAGRAPASPAGRRSATAGVVARLA